MGPLISPVLWKDLTEKKEILSSVMISHRRQIDFRYLFKKRSFDHDLEMKLDPTGLSYSGKENIFVEVRPSV